MKPIIFLLLYIFIIACNEPNAGFKLDDFYTDKGNFDKGRIPLIKPYEAATSATVVNWIVESIDTTTVPLTIPGTKEIMVTKGTIFLHSTNTVLNYQPIKEGWFVIIPKSNIVQGFTTHQEYLSYVHDIGFKSEPKLHSIGKVFDYFDSNDHIDWQDIE